MSLLQRLSTLLGRSEHDPQADPAIMRGIGDAVRSRLLDDPHIEARGGDKADLFLMPGLLTAQECRKLIAIIDSRIQPSVLFSEKVAPKGRTSSTHFFSQEMPETKALAAKIGTITGIEPIHAEPLQGQRYDVGQEFKPHCDWFNPDGQDYEKYCSVAGQRTWTFMVYLNEVESGGATRFKAIRKSFQPETGKLVCWNNRRPDLRPNPNTIHHGMKVRKGVKYVITKWYREKPWGW